MVFPHRPICVVPAFINVLIGITLSYIFFILSREFINIDSYILLQGEKYKIISLLLSSIKNYAIYF